MLIDLTTCKGLRPLGSYEFPWHEQVRVVGPVFTVFLLWPTTLPYNAMSS